MAAVIFRRHLPRTPTDCVAFIFLIAAIHAVVIFQVFHVLPTIYSSVEHGSPDNMFNLYYLHMLLGFYIYLVVLFNLYKVMTINTTVREKMLPAILPPGWRFCYSCESNSPPRSFHCHICNICVLKRDHHCTFTGNCVGVFNLRYYLGLCLFMSLAAGYSCVLNMDYFYHLFGTISLKTFLTVSFPLVSWLFVQTDKMSGYEVFMTSLTLVGFCLSTGLFVYHMNNVVSGQTTFERTYNILDYRLAWKENVKLALGTRWKIALLCPLIQSPIPSDGLEFVTKTQYESLKTM